MVGVPGKYKGCNTCRLRRVKKCDNERPFCRKCIDSGRKCEGYERERIFIIGTPEQGGRCSSHPRRNVPSRSSKKASTPARSDTSSRSEEPERVKQEDADQGERLELVAIEPLRPAWDDIVALSRRGTVYHAQISALNTSLAAIVHDDEMSRGKATRLFFPPYIPPDTRPSMGNDEFGLRSHCMAHLSEMEETRNEVGETVGTNSICLFLFEQQQQNTSMSSSISTPWAGASAQGSSASQPVPGSFRNFPAHHFFVRVLRHNGICTALLNRKSTFLAEHEWTTVPWESHPKSALDRLFDVLALLPRPPGAGRPDNDERPDSGGLETRIPFADALAFRDGATALGLSHYWTALVCLWPCMERLHQAIFQPVLDEFPQMFPDLPDALLHVDPARYAAKETRELAACICRSLDGTLAATVQPDLVAVPLAVAEGFFRELNASTGDGALELMWCEAFRSRLTAKGQDIADVIQGRDWAELARF
ncbi:hypothetical protein MAPG_01117 [Magnaporthiopsis poae ATCC 64411]|uniref:Zn(2)-C6 fungal-type domain-containing protein n=1 Tax=Magnaporthiopsis poae (strain ATCC 64411 / 73-15) TaxID=644358 RepID=A0A0C4DMV2_MAGP6|nr:hypothetical protein MAPG_01117 [Magnaporthiopsis poae ATCC 64411]